MAYEFIPTLVTNEQGEEVPSYEQGTLERSDQLHRGLGEMGFEHNELTGETQYFEINDKEDGQAFQMSEYLQTMQEVNPELSDAITYGNANLSPELMSELYTAIDDEDLENLNEILVIILSEYDDAKIATPEEREETQQEVEEEEQDELEDLEVPDLSSLYETEPSYELMDTFSDLADNAEGAEQLIYQLSARFHSGGESQDELIELALSSGYSRQELITAFNLING